MTLSKHLTRLEPEELVDVYRHWAGDIGMPTKDGALVQRELIRLMTDRDRVMKRFAELPAKCRDFVTWMLNHEDFAFPVSKFRTEDIADLPIKGFEVDAIAFALKKRGFLMEIRDLSWHRYDELVYMVPNDLGEILLSNSTGSARTLESQWSLRAFLRTFSRSELDSTLDYHGVKPTHRTDRAALLHELCSPERVQRAISAFKDEDERSLLIRILGDHGGIGEARHMERMGFKISDPEGFKARLEEQLLGSLLDTDLSDVGLQFGRGSIVLFFDVVKAWHTSRLEVVPEDDSKVSADVLSDLSAIRTFIDHHNVRVTRDGDLYRATKKKMAADVLSPGERPLDPEESLRWLLKFLEDAELIRPDADLRLRNTKSWDSFELRGPVERTELLLTHVENDLRDARGAFHLPRLRRIFMSVLRELGPGRWFSLRSLSILARNRYFLTMDRPALRDRFQQRYKFTPVPPLANPSMLINELVRYGGSGLAFAGLVDIEQSEEGPMAVRLTRLGAAVLGVATKDAEPAVADGAMVVTADFELVVFPDQASIELLHELGRFAKREKADLSVHYRITERSIQEAVALGLDAKGILLTLERHSRHDIPQNVRASITSWASLVSVLNARKITVLKGTSKAAIDQLLKIREIKAIVVERLNDTTLELSEDPSAIKVTEALRAQGFFLR